MERKIGEIFEYNGEWCQCIVGNDCENCDFNERKCYTVVDNGDPIGDCCVDRRKDNKDVIFKKLEKVGEPFTCNIHGDERLVWMQEYKLYDVNFCKENALLMYVSDYKHKRIAIELKQNKEDMEDLDKIKVRDYTKVEELNVMEEKKLNLKPFDIQKAREGKPVCTRDGRKVRVLCYDFKQNEEYPILVAVENKDGKECALLYSNGGISEMYKSSNNELAMLPEKKEGWVNVYKGGLLDTKSYPTKKEAFDKACPEGYVDTIKINWSE